jgi:hypothetical protein
MLGANELGEFLEGRELVVFGKDTGVIGHWIQFLKVEIAERLNRCYSRFSR